MELYRKQISVGVDLHKSQFTVCAIVPSGEVLLEAQYPTTEEGYESFISWCHEKAEELGFSISMAVESTGNARYFKNLMQSENFEVIVINTNKFKVIVKSANKTDKHDAKTIAVFLDKDFLPESHLCSQWSEDLRRMLKLRKMHVESCVQIKNNIHGMMLSYGYTTSAEQFQSKRKRKLLEKELEAHGIFNPSASKILKLLLESLSMEEEVVNKINEEIEEYCKEDEDIDNLRTVPGIGLVTAATIKAYVDDIERFESYKSFSAYCGLVPYVKSSNESTYLGHITKNGPTELRTAMVQVVMGMLRLKMKYPNWRLLLDYEYMKSRNGSGKSIIATARKMSRIIFCMLERHERFDSSRMAIRMSNPEIMIYEE